MALNTKGVSTHWNFPHWFPLTQLVEGVSIRKASESNAHQDAVLLVINLNDNVWQSIKDKLKSYKATILVQTEAYQGWEVAYEQCSKFDVFLNFDRTYAWHPGFVKINLPYDPAVGSSHLDKRGWHALKAQLVGSRREALGALLGRLLPRKNKAVLISSLHPGDRYRIRLETAKANASWVDVYGSGWPSDLPNYCGRCVNKIATLRRYKYAVVFENQRQPGYITEKLLDCFVAGTVPIYWGAPDVHEHIPPASYLIAHGNFGISGIPAPEQYSTLSVVIREKRQEVFRTFSVSQFMKTIRQGLTVATQNSIAAR